MDVIVSINPLDKGRCGECEVKVGKIQSCAWSEQREVGEWFGTPGDEVSPRWRRQEKFRGPLCLAAEKKLWDLVEAGNGMTAGAWYSQSKLWDRAIAALEEEAR